MTLSENIVTVAGCVILLAFPFTNIVSAVVFESILVRNRIVRKINEPNLYYFYLDIYVIIFACFSGYMLIKVFSI